MSETNSNPPGAVPPKPPEAAKVQPKKETVRINLPPKPAAVPSIKIPAPPASGGSGRAPSAPAAAPATAPAASHAVPAAAGPATAARSAAAPTAAPRAAAAPRPSAPAVSGLDKGLAIAAVVLSVAVLVRLIFVMITP